MTNRELDVEIERKVFKNEKSVAIWDKYCGFQNGMKTSGYDLSIDQLKSAKIQLEYGRNLELLIPHYSTDLNKAFLVIEKMREKIKIFKIFKFNVHWICEFIVSGDLGGVDRSSSQDESPARAICLCALKVMEEMEKKWDT